jgi:hypothetical protein
MRHSDDLSELKNYNRDPIFPENFIIWIVIAAKFSTTGFSFFPAQIRFNLAEEDLFSFLYFEARMFQALLQLRP